jgi:hypothetical protein
VFGIVPYGDGWLNAVFAAKGCRKFPRLSSFSTCVLINYISKITWKIIFPSHINQALATINFVPQIQAPTGKYSINRSTPIGDHRGRVVARAG